MSTARARANHSLYLARILLSTWGEALAREELPARTLGEAFEPAVSEHLIRAYGWFLLHVSQPGELPPAPPRRCAELPGAAEGKAVAGEIREFEQLEQHGWLAELLGARQGPEAADPQPGNLLGAVLMNPGPAELTSWADQMEQLFDRMGDSLDEY